MRALRPAPSAFRPTSCPGGWTDAGSISIGLNYDLDLWGKNRTTLRAAMSDADAAAARLALSTGIASTYAELVRLHALKDAAETNLRIRIDSERLIQARKTAGLENDAALARADAGRSGAAADVAAVDQQIELVRNQIAALLGTGPGRGKAIELPNAPRLRSFGLPRISASKWSAAARISSPLGCAPRPWARASRRPRPTSTRTSASPP